MGMVRAVCRPERHRRHGRVRDRWLRWPACILPINHQPFLAWGAGMKKGDKRFVHGLSKCRLYNIWAKMKSRCYNEKEPCFPRYGGRGIKICAQWHSDFKKFHAWAMANGYSDELSIDRFPNADGDYKPSNCRWATPAQQGSNRASDLKIFFRGERKNLSDLARQVGIGRATVRHRIFVGGWSIEKALTTPVRQW